MRRKFTDPIYYVYVFFRPNGIPCYVGLGTKNRIQRQFASSHNPHLARIMAKAGGTLPVVKVREGLSFEQAAETEIALIAALGREIDGGILVNISTGGEGASGVGPSESCLEAIKIAMQRPETRENCRQAKLGTKASDATRQKMSEARIGMKMSEEACANMSNARQRVVAEKRALGLNPNKAYP